MPRVATEDDIGFWRECWEHPPTTYGELMQWRIYCTFWDSNDCIAPGYWVRRWLIRHPFEDLSDYIKDWLHEATTIQNSRSYDGRS